MTRVRQRFTPLQRLLHWLMAVCILAMLFIGVGMVSTVMPKYLTLVSIHKPLGIAILVLALIRLAVRLRYGAPPLPADLPEPMKLAAHLSHYALYALMIAMPLIGWAMLSAAAYPVVLFGGVHLPAILPQSDSLHALLWNAHFYLAFVFFALILLHVAAALFHALVRRDGVFEAMASASPTTRSCPPSNATLPVCHCEERGDRSKPGPTIASAAGALQPQRRLYLVGVLQRRADGVVDFKIVLHAAVDALELPSRQSFQPVPTLPLPGLQNIQRREKSDEVDVVLRQHFPVLLRSLPANHYFVNNEVVALVGHRTNGIQHAAHGALHDRARRDHNRRMTLFLCRRKCQSVGMPDHFLWAACR